MAKDIPITFGGRVRVRTDRATEALGLASLVGLVYGETTPSVTRVEVIGEPREDYAVNVHFEERGEAFWLARDLLEFVDHAPGTEVRLHGIDKKWVRSESGKWEETGYDAPPRTLMSKIARFFKKRR